jgi:hypothetical protein
MKCVAGNCCAKWLGVLKSFILYPTYSSNSSGEILHLTIFRQGTYRHTDSKVISYGFSYLLYKERRLRKAVHSAVIIR